ncbi:MAG: hypothetical protein ACREHV_05340, partial [Rhizomicrobium sp.]
ASRAPSRGRRSCAASASCVTAPGVGDASAGSSRAQLWRWSEDENLLRLKPELPRWHCGAEAKLYDHTR